MHREFFTNKIKTIESLESDYKDNISITEFLKLIANTIHAKPEPDANLDALNLEIERLWGCISEPEKCPDFWKALIDYREKQGHAYNRSYLDERYLEALDIGYLLQIQKNVFHSTMLESDQITNTNKQLTLEYYAAMFNHFSNLDKEIKCSSLTLRDNKGIKVTCSLSHAFMSSKYNGFLSLLDAKKYLYLYGILSDDNKPQAEALADDVADNTGKNTNLLKAPARQDDWFELINDMTTAFYNDFGELPNQAQAWGRLCTSPPSGYTVTTGKDKGGEDCLKMPGTKPLPKNAFYKRWNKYTANKSQ